MSYILDALKKAERERGMTKVPTLSTVHDSGEKPSHRFLFLSIAGLVLLASGLGLFLFPWDRDDPTATGSAEYTGQLPAPGSNEFSDPKVAPSTTLSLPSSSDRSIPPAESPSQPARSVRTIPGVSSADTTPNTPIISPSPAQKSQSGTISQQELQKQIPPEAAGPFRADSSPRSSSSPSRDIAPVEIQPRESGTASQESSLHQAMKEMNISILFYAENPSDRMVFINGRKYVEGEYIDERFLLERITPDGAVLSYQGGQAILKPKTD